MELRGYGFFQSLPGSFVGLNLLIMLCNFIVDDLDFQSQVQKVRIVLKLVEQRVPSTSQFFKCFRYHPYSRCR